MTPDVAFASPAPVPTVKPDLRPTADTAALLRDAHPNIPLPIPASNGQSAAVTQSRVSSSAASQPLEAVDSTERVLKPYGVAMLPETASRDADREKDAQGDPSASKDGIERRGDDTPKPYVERSKESLVGASLPALPDNGPQGNNPKDTKEVAT